MRKIAVSNTVLGKIGDRVEDGPLGAAMREFAEIVQEYLYDASDTSIYATAMADKGMDICHFVMDLLEELGLVNPDQ